MHLRGHQVPRGTVVLGNSDLVLRFTASDPAAADAKMRMLLGGNVFDQDAGSAMWAMSGAQIGAGAIRGTTSRALDVGTLLSTSSDPVADVAKLLGGSVLVRGTITASDGANSVTVVNVNENLIAYSGQSATVLATAPDLLCYVT